MPPSGPLPNVPPPPPEVKVRTLRSDLESMAKSGGAAPQFESVKAPSLVNLAQDRKVSEGKGISSEFVTVVVTLLAIALTVAIAYFAYQIFLNSG